MRPTFLPYNQPEVGEDEWRAVGEAIMSRWITRGRLTQQLEEALADYLGVPEVVGLSSCTAGLHLALMAAGVGPGDEVISTPMTFAASINVIDQVGAKPVLVDVDEDTGNLNLDLVEQAITRRTKAVLPVHYGGHSVDLVRLNRIRDRWGLAIIEDAAHALGSRHDGHLVGSSGNLTAFSFYATKNLTTGEGGALVVPDAAMAERIRALSLHGLSRNAWNRYSEGGDWRYDVMAPGYKYNMTDIEAAMGLTQWAKFEAMQQKRAQLASHYQQRLRLLPVVVPAVRPGFDHAWHLFPIHLRLDVMSKTRDQVIEELRRRNIGTAVHFIPIPHFTYYQRRYGFKPNDFPHAETFYASEISLPLYPSMSFEDVDDVVDALAESVGD
ncbi:DegT/DnrJ/EryC1/StrS family aminotransferase [Sulfobacillus harzensis]|uniref:DegT/DnrJ/EryC1/StrS family aminotransferase n=1 Tax=Sulfobacillus harzensis TaxID=2729629 RepID=A0A7Y0L3B9_9FIRM|nr:DegT/DnrJ/EryC1/StrS family aminotransferase [Sulfobacillus harzensis]NMP22544.1 DegT/DnrJ/EryC1/StrS family aminotransferase [Sulfobacillus harzensis]